MSINLFFKKPRPSKVLLGLLWVALAAPLLFGMHAGALGTTAWTSSTSETNYDLYPVLEPNSQPPLVMLAMSRDEQLFIKAYTDYTDLDGDGIIDTTYNDAFEYSGYFGSNFCYAYSSSVFKVSSAATGNYNHSCSGAWSGNFMNWLTMSRLDIVRMVLYGGLRSTDTFTQTVLERAAITSDLHSWAKVYSGSDIGSFTPYSSEPNNTLTFCNTTPVGSTTPELLIAKNGPYPQWATDENSQCKPTRLQISDYETPALGDVIATDVVRVDVCDAFTSNLREPFCRAYNNSTTGVTDYKPAGLLQEYGEDGRMRFGLMTGSDADPRTGGRLRRNIGLFAGSGSDPTTCAGGDEVRLSDGTFCKNDYSDNGFPGIINTLDRFKLVGWDTTGMTTTWNLDCGQVGILNRQDSAGDNYLDDPGTAVPYGGSGYHCNAWGNPLSEIYAEAVRYIEGHGNAATPLYESGDDTTYLSGIPDHVGWIDPYGTAVTTGNNTGGGNPYCATCSIIILSTGLNSFDADEIPGSDSGANPIVSQQKAYDATNDIGADETMSGDYLIGRVLANPNDLAPGNQVNTYQDECGAHTLGGNGYSLGLARGICPDVPSLEGSYYVAGLAFKAWTTDLRPDLETSQQRPSTYKNTVKTYAVQLAESLPSFNIPVSGGTINFAPACQANNNANALITDSGWRSCSLGGVQIGAMRSAVAPNFTYGRPLLSDGSAGSFLLTWEDSPWGFDHDLDVMAMVTYCAGSACNYQTMVGQRTDNLGNPWTGYDICWRTDHTSTNLDYSSICANPPIGSTDEPSVGANQVLVRVEYLYAASADAMVGGYSISGTNHDGADQTRWVYKGGISNGSVLTGISNFYPIGWYKPMVFLYDASGSGAKSLESPLWYAAKYGGFNDLNGSGTPDQQDEWDTINNTTGLPGSDGVPDNFYPVHNPAVLGDELGNALNAILAREGASSAAAVVANTLNGDGVVYRALYHTLQSDAEGNTAKWNGDLNTLWVDSYGLLREDNGNATLDGYDTDPIVVFYTDATDNTAKFNECQTSDPTFNPANFDPNNLPLTCPGNTGRQNQSLDALETVWDAQNELSDSSGSFAGGLAVQRPYSNNADTGRYIFTWIDANHNGVVDSGEQTDFIWNTANPELTCPGVNGGFCGKVTLVGVLSSLVTGNMSFLNTKTTAEAACIVNWIRGVESNTTNNCKMRNRTVNDANGDPKVYRLGDIVDSTPLVVGRPAENYDLLYGDDSFATFRSHYIDRRQMVYVGADDGLVHAFNAGFYDAAHHKLTLQDPSGSGTAHPLGSEIWAYAPFNLLPHLRWLTDPNYRHVFYADGPPVATDAKIFANDSNHPGGWGTVLVVPYRLGGGQISLPTWDGVSGDFFNPAQGCNGSGGPNKCVTQTDYSGYMVLDVTNPEVAPTVLTELHPASDDGNGQSYATSVPAFAVIRDPASGTPNKFYLYIGSGPTSVSQTKVTSTAPLRLYAYDMGCFTGQVTVGCGSPATSAPIKSFDFSNGGTVSQGKNSFAGDLLASDFDLDDKTEGVYFGSIRDDQPLTTPREYTGSLWKLAINEDTTPANWTPTLMYDAKLPISAHVTLGLNDRFAPEIYAGTGRVFDNTDLTTTGQQQIMGMIDPSLLPSGDPQFGSFSLPLSAGDLLDVTSIGICGEISGSCTAIGNVLGQSGVNTFTQLLQLFDESKSAGGYAGFYFDLPASGTTPAERVVNAQALLGGLLISNSFTPGTDICTGQGTGTEYVMDFRTGTANPSSTLFGFNGNGTVKLSTSLGAGLPSSPSLHAGSGGDQNSTTIKACTQTSTGAIICQTINSLIPVTSGEASWREPLSQ